MKRALALLVGGVLILGSVLTAHAQAPTVSFGGQMRIYGFTFNNVTDFKDSDRRRQPGQPELLLPALAPVHHVESADKKAKACWGLEVGDLFGVAGGGASGGEFRGCTGVRRSCRP